MHFVHSVLMITKLRTMCRVSIVSAVIAKATHDRTNEQAGCMQDLTDETQHENVVTFTD